MANGTFTYFSINSLFMRDYKNAANTPVVTLNLQSLKKNQCTLLLNTVTQSVMYHLPYLLSDSQTMSLFDIGDFIAMWNKTVDILEDSIIQKQYYLNPNLVQSMSLEEAQNHACNAITHITDENGLVSADGVWGLLHVSLKDGLDASNVIINRGLCKAVHEEVSHTQVSTSFSNTEYGALEIKGSIIQDLVPQPTSLFLVCYPSQTENIRKSPFTKLALLACNSITDLESWVNTLKIYPPSWKAAALGLGLISRQKNLLVPYRPTWTLLHKKWTFKNTPSTAQILYNKDYVPPIKARLKIKRRLRC
uniref:Uncharacterized protein n=1 Tax=Ranid herpesvirus 4 TaxID=2849006 RepID=A0A8F3CIG9_9VIRU|nr:MAG: hypothetical protein [Ranid herpesvirus 4]